MRGLLPHVPGGRAPVKVGSESGKAGGEEEVFCLEVVFDVGFSCFCVQRTKNVLGKSSTVNSAPTTLFFQIIVICSKPSISHQVEFCCDRTQYKSPSGFLN